MDQTTRGWLARPRPSRTFEPTFDGARSGYSARRAEMARLLVAFLALGFGWRIARYAANPPLWGDEAFVAVNLLTRGYRELLRPLEYHQIAPVGFLWVAKAAVGALGPSEWALRLAPFLSGLAALALFARFATGAVDRRSALMAVGVFAASFYPVRHATEIKPYATDLLLGLVTIQSAWATWRFPRSIRRWLTLGLVVAVGVWVSYPLVFVVGGVGMVLAVRVWEVRDPKAGAAFGAFGLASGSSWLASYLLVARAQAAASPFYHQLETWRGAFPPWGRPWMLPYWLLDVHAGNMLAYPNGGNNFGSVASLALVIAGILALRKSRPALLVMLLAPLGPTLLASALKLYPYGTSARTTLYMAPSFCLLAGMGIVSILRRLQVVQRRRGYRIASVGLLGMIALMTVIDVARPYKNFEDGENRRVARELAALARPGDRWVVFDGLATLPDTPGLMLEHWLQQAAEVRYDLMAVAPGPILRMPRPLELAEMTTGRAWLILHRSGSPDFDEAWLEADRSTMESRFGPARIRHFPMTRGESITAYEFDPL